jgi:hypothetical protein
MRLKCKSNGLTVIRGTPRIRSSVDLTVARMILFILDGTTNLILKEQQKFYKIHALLAKMCVHTKGKKNR